MELKGKSAIVTGSSRGLGRAIALALAERGMRVVVNYNTNEYAAKETVEMIENLGGEAIAVKADVRNREEVSVMVELAVEEFGSIDVLVNNAGVAGRYRSISDIDDEDWRNVIETNLTGAFIVTQEVLKYMEKGKIIHFISRWKDGWDYWSPLCCFKGWADRLHLLPCKGACPRHSGERHRSGPHRHRDHR